MFNSVAALTNTNKIAYRISNVSPWKEIVLPDGFYDIKSFNSYIKLQLAVNGDVSDNIEMITAVFGPKFQITLKGGYELDLQDSRSKLNRIFGFDSQILSGAAVHYGEHGGNVVSYDCRGVTTLFIKK